MVEQHESSVLLGADLVKNTKHYNMRLNDRLHHDLSQSQSQSSNCPIVGANSNNGGGSSAIEGGLMMGCNNMASINQQQQQKKNLRLALGGNPLIMSASACNATNASNHHLHEYAFDNPYFKDDQLINDRQSTASNLSMANSPTPLSPLPALHHNNNGNNSQQNHHHHHHLHNQHASSHAELGQHRHQLQLHTMTMADNDTEAAHTHDHHHRHFNEHISNLHQIQLSTSVNELTINGGKLDTRHLNAVDLTADGSNRLARETREGDLVAVDITGHDFIGLGFDITGNERDGIFVRSVLSRGPANESGCIEAGDKIKGLTISFDNIFLRDAIDILNCGAPYKLRLLMEKQAALLVADSSGHRSQQQQSTGGNSSSANNLAKSYIRKITSFCSPTSSSSSGGKLSSAGHQHHHHHNHNHHQMTLEQQMNRNKNYVINVDSLSSVNNVAIDVVGSPHDQLSKILGSVSARQARDSDLLNKRSTFVDYTGAHLDRHHWHHHQADQQQTSGANLKVSNGDLFSADAHSVADASSVNNHSATTMDNNQAVENFDDDDDDDDDNNSLQFNRNDSHHLHGPSHRRATVAQATNIQAIGTSIDGAQNDHRVFGLGIGSTSNSNNNGNNHHHHDNSRHNMGDNQLMEQTRSQPTIAVVRRDSDLGLSSVLSHQQSQLLSNNKRFSPNKYFSSTVAVSTPAMNFSPTEVILTSSSNCNGNSSSGGSSGGGGGGGGSNNSNNSNNNNGDNLTQTNNNKQQRQQRQQKDANGSGNSTITTTGNSQFSSIEEMSFDDEAQKERKKTHSINADENTTGPTTTIKDNPSMTMMMQKAITITDNVEPDKHSNGRRMSENVALTVASNDNNQQQSRGHRRLKSTGGNLGIVLDNFKKESVAKVKPTIDEFPLTSDRMTHLNHDIAYKLDISQSKFDAQQQLSDDQQHKLSTSSGGGKHSANSNVSAEGVSQTDKFKSKNQTIAPNLNSDDSLSSDSTSGLMANSSPLVVSSPNNHLHSVPNTSKDSSQANDKSEKVDSTKSHHHHQNHQHHLHDNDRKDITSENATN